MSTSPGSRSRGGAAGAATTPADPPVAVLGIDGGNSKAEIVLVGGDGRLCAHLRGTTVSHQAVPIDVALASLDDLVGRAADAAGLDPGRRPLARVAVLCVAGADSARDIGLLRRAIEPLRIAEQLEIRNDTEAPLRAGSDEGWGVAVVTGAGLNAIGRTRDGRTARFAALGDITGEHGGGGGAGMFALGAAVRAQEGRGPRTALETVIPQFFGYRRPLDVAFAIAHGRIGEGRLRELSPVVFRTAAEGDVVAREILDRLADEIVSFVSAAIRRLHLSRAPVPVTLAGGVFRARDDAFVDRIRAGVEALAPRAVVAVLDAPPVLGAALLGLDALGADPAAGRRLRAELRQQAPV